MMNLRILKKLSKRAAPYLPLLGDHREQFRAVRDENYHGTCINARKHMSRGRCHPTYDPISGEEIVYTSRAGYRVRIGQPLHPRKGTVMVGSITGYYEPEWDEESAYDALWNHVRFHFTDWSQGRPVATRDISTPARLFAAVDDMLIEMETQR